MIKILKINFVDFWPNFQKNDNYFFHLLNTKYNVEINENDPDLLFFSVDYFKMRQRDRYLDHPCKKIFYTGENVRANLEFPGSLECERYSVGKSDFAFTFDYSADPRQYRLPLWALFINWFELPPNDYRDPSYLIPLSHLLNRKFDRKKKFCNFIFSNSSGERINILNNISSYKKVDSAGSLLNNIGYQIKGRGDEKYKIEFLKNYRFTIAAENSDHPGYTTEKIIHPLSVGSIPIYWGSDQVASDFNPECFINVNNFESYKEMIEYIVAVDNDDNLLEKHMAGPVFPDNKIPENIRPENVLSFFEDEILC